MVVKETQKVDAATSAAAGAATATATGIHRSSSLTIGVQKKMISKKKHVAKEIVKSKRDYVDLLYGKLKPKATAIAISRNTASGR